MCILFIAVKQHPQFPLIIAANRDEFHQRPTKPSHVWDSQNEVLAGLDLRGGGTWMGVNKFGDIAALTNIRAPDKERKNAVTRGELVSHFLLEDVSSSDYLNTLSKTKMDYNGYNLLFGELNQLKVYNSFEDKDYNLTDGVYGLSNASLNSPWPKLDMGRSELAKYCQQADYLNIEHLFELLSNNQVAKDEELPQTGVPIEWEKKLSSIFIASEEYGTRSSTILLVDKHNKVYWEERSFAPNTSATGTEKFEFTLIPKN